MPPGARTVEGRGRPVGRPLCEGGRLIATTRIESLHAGKKRTVGKAIRDIIDYVENPQKTPNLAAGGSLNGGNLIPGTVGTEGTTAALPGVGGGSADASYPTVDYPTASGPVISFTELTSDLYNSDGSLGTLNIPSIGLTVKIYEGTGDAPLLKGAGHFTGTTAWDGNYCVAGHNRGVRNDFGKIHTLKSGDTINLTTSMGSRTYSVTSVSKVDVTDTSMLDATADNCITLFTCVENQPAYRWCVRAVAG